MSDPRLLTHPNIPKPLHGVAPRTIFGQAWWDVERRKAYAAKGFHCWACGIHKLDTDEKWLEAHESYAIDYANGRVTLKEIVALCHKCHNFIHSGRLFVMVAKKKVSKAKALAILRHGFELLKRAGLKPFCGTALAYLLLTGHSQEEAVEILEERGLGLPDDVSMPAWEDWRMVIDGQEYPPLYGSYEEWSARFSEVNDE